MFSLKGDEIVFNYKNLPVCFFLLKKLTLEVCVFLLQRLLQSL